MKRIFAVLLAALMLSALLTVTASADLLDQIQERGTIIIGLEGGF